MNKVLVCLIGESASGKDSLANLLEKEGYKVLKSYTTRSPRPNEYNTHIFIKPEEVIKYKNNMIAYTRIGEYEYFATYDQLKESDIYIIDPIGYYELKKKVKNVKLIPIYINVSEQTRYERALQRINYDEKQKQEIDKRFIAEYDQFQKFRKNEEFYSIINHNINKAVEIIKKIIELEKENK